MDKFIIEFYEKENGDIPVEEFLPGVKVKKSEKTPKVELGRAKAYRDDYLERCVKNEKT